jgi:hypothetical protein
VKGVNVDRVSTTNSWCKQGINTQQVIKSHSCDTVILGWNIFIASIIYISASPSKHPRR